MSDAAWAHAFECPDVVIAGRCSRCGGTTERVPSARPDPLPCAGCFAGALTRVRFPAPIRPDERWRPDAAPAVVVVLEKFRWAEGGTSLLDPRRRTWWRWATPAMAARWREAGWRADTRPRVLEAIRNSREARLSSRILDRWIDEMNAELAPYLPEAP